MAGIGAIIFVVLAIVLCLYAKHEHGVSAKAARDFANGKSDDRGFGGFGFSVGLYIGGRCQRKL